MAKVADVLTMMPREQGKPSSTPKLANCPDWAQLVENGPAQVSDVATNPPLVGTADNDAAKRVPMNYNYFELFSLENLITNGLYFAHTLLIFNRFLVFLVAKILFLIEIHYGTATS